MKRLSSFLAVSFTLALLATTAQAATSGTATVTLAATANTMIQILDAAVTLTPTPTDYDNDYVDAAGASGLRVRVRTNSSGGLMLKVKCADAVPQIALSDLLIKTATAPGGAGASVTTYTPVSASDMDLWTSSVAQHAWVTVTTDIRIQNIGAYDDAAGGGTTDYTNTLTYTVIAQ